MILKSGRPQNLGLGERSNNQPQDSVVAPEGLLTIGLCAFHRARSAGLQIRLIRQLSKLNCKSPYFVNVIELRGLCLLLLASPKL